MTIEQAEANLVGCQRRDEIKRIWCERRNIELLTIKYDEFDNINETLRRRFL